MTEQDRETHAAIEALAHRIRVRDAALAAGEDCGDAEPFAAEFLAALRGRGWRLTPAKTTPPPLHAPPVADKRSRDEEVAAVRAQMAEMAAARERQDGAA